MEHKNYFVGTESIILPKRQPASKIDRLISFFHLSKIFSNKGVVSVINLDGIIGKVGISRSGLTLSILNKHLEKAFSFHRLVAVCLIVNSPGGSPAQSELIANRIIQLANKKKVPVYSFIEDVAASGGYWLACAGNEIYALKNSILGSIGVISSSFGLHEAITKLGIERRVYSSGKNKSILDPFLPAKDSDIDIIKNIQQQIHTHFIHYIKKRRGKKLTQKDDVIFNGEFWTGELALEYGLIDGIDDLYNFLDKKFGESIHIEYISEKSSWVRKKLGIVADTFSSKLIDNVADSIHHHSIVSKYRNY